MLIGVLHFAGQLRRLDQRFDLTTTATAAARETAMTASPPRTSGVYHAGAD